MMDMVRFLFLLLLLKIYTKRSVELLALPLLKVSDVRPAHIGVSSYAGKVVNVRRLDEVINSIDSWYMERGLFGMVSFVHIVHCKKVSFVLYIPDWLECIERNFFC